ncbi:hypothetical protein P9443_19195 [Peribacillus frigoritolerans]|uniref:hypothetical protein n=1 Tax=Peribacillus frigoritolerans TaxID=450367 RepID=UPI002E1B0C2B|nr:hypothetical protein [Peribacillus frigoritolerans]
MEKIPPIVKTYVSKKEEITLHIPNVRYAKENSLLKTARAFSHEIVLYNMETCGFGVISTKEHEGVYTFITTKCCNPDCDGTSEKRYLTFIQNERLPLCKSCLTIIRSINKINKRPIVAIKDGERIEFPSVAEAGRQLNIPPKNVYNFVMRGAIHSSGYRFEFLD